MIAETQTASSSPVHADVLAALKTASAKTGSDFDYLLSTAMRESRLDCHAKSTSSSATGLFQFIDQTWLGLIKRYGEGYGLKDYAGAIRETGNGHYEVACKDTKSAILALRQDAQLSALMAGEAAKETKQALECKLGREVCSGELYAAHFLGEGSARHLIELNASNPDARADLAFPQAASANRGAFYHADGKPKTVAEVYAWTVGLPGDAKIKPAPNPNSGAPAQLASALAVSEPDAVAPQSTPAMKHIRQFQPALANAAPRHGRTAAPTWMKRESPLTHTGSYLRLSPGMLEVLAALAPAQFALKRTG
jgi:hypothetical protein